MSRIDKLKWKRGPWDGECDDDEWQYKGVACEIRRKMGGAWCGYVEVPSGHPWFSLRYQDIPAECHGGLTYGHATAAENTIGFDCSHMGGDLAPGMKSMFIGDDQTYRDEAYVRHEVELLAEQILKAAGG